MSSKKKRPYSERTDIEKIKSNWVKTRGLISRGEWSGSIIRAATVVELAANLVVRKELQDERGLDGEFVDHLLIWANGVQGKLDRLILPVCRGTSKHRVFRRMKRQIREINSERNRMVHGGHFSSEKKARKIAREAHEVITALVTTYEPRFRMKEIE